MAHHAADYWDGGKVFSRKQTDNIHSAVMDKQIEKLEEEKRKLESLLKWITSS